MKADVSETDKSRQDDNSELSKTKKLIGELLKSPIQCVFLTIGLACLAGCFPFTYYCYQFTVKAKKEAPISYEFPDWRDFWMTSTAAILFLTCDMICFKVLPGIFRPYCKEQEDHVERERKAVRQADSVYRFIYFTAITIYGYSVVKDEAYFPRALGGSGDYNLCTQGFPYQQHNDGIKDFLLISLGFHCAVLFKMIFIAEKRNDFIEMVLHDIITIYLYGGCYLVNVWEIGATIALIHDCSDIVLQLMKIFAETKAEILTGIAFITETLIWFYTRILVFPWIVYVSTTQSNLQMGHQLIVPYFAAGLYFLCFMHWYWFRLLLRVLYKVIKGEKLQKQEDIRFKKKGNVDEESGSMEQIDKQGYDIIQKSNELETFNEMETN